MRKIDNPEVFRTNIRSNLTKILDNDKLSNNLEKGIFNYVIGAATELNIVKKWENVYFVQLYIDRLRTVYINLKNPTVLKMMTAKGVKIHKLAFMSHQEMRPDKWTELIEEKKIRDKNKYEPKVEASSDNFTCWKCKSKKCTYYQLQTRSADEPMTTFVTCLDCGNRFKC